MSENKKHISDVIKDKTERMMSGVAYWSAFYRLNPQRFAKDFLNLNLRLFQKILLYAMMCNYYFIYIAARGQGKTWLTAVFCVIGCILYPGTKIVVCSGTKNQAIEVLSKITDDLCKSHTWGSANLNNEISFKSTAVNNPVIEFKNGSWIKVKTATDNARGKILPSQMKLTSRFENIRDEKSGNSKNGQSERKLYFKRYNTHNA